jgi:hypothetical protein
MCGFCGDDRGGTEIRPEEGKFTEKQEEDTDLVCNRGEKGDKKPRNGWRMDEVEE